MLDQLKQAKIDVDQDRRVYFENLDNWMSNFLTNFLNCSAEEVRFNIIKYRYLDRKLLIDTMMVVPSISAAANLMIRQEDKSSFRCQIKTDSGLEYSPIVSLDWLLANDLQRPTMKILIKEVRTQFENCFYS